MLDFGWALIRVIQFLRRVVNAHFLQGLSLMQRCLSYNDCLLSKSDSFHVEVVSTRMRSNFFLSLLNSDCKTIDLFESQDAKTNYYPMQ